MTSKNSLLAADPTKCSLYIPAWIAQPTVTISPLGLYSWTNYLPTSVFPLIIPISGLWTPDMLFILPCLGMCLLNWNFHCFKNTFFYFQLFLCLQESYKNSTESFCKPLTHVPVSILYNRSTMFNTKALTLIGYFQLHCRPYLKLPYLLVHLILACFTRLLRHYLLLSSSFPISL